MMVEKILKTREDICAYVRERYGAELEYLWVKTPGNGVFRHNHNRKWFAAIVDITEDKLGLDGKEPIDALLLKCGPELKTLLIDHVSVFPAYHMNREHWITVRLGIENPKIQEMIDFSYNLTKV